MGYSCGNTRNPRTQKKKTGGNQSFSKCVVIVFTLADSGNYSRASPPIAWHARIGEVCGFLQYLLVLYQTASISSTSLLASRVDPHDLLDRHP